MKQRNRTRRTSNMSFSPLEPRQMLATLFLGTDGYDTASIEYAGENLVDIRINDTLHENVDSSEGIRINLGRANSPEQLVVTNLDLDSPLPTDTIKIDHRITDSVFVHNANEILIDGGDNVIHAFTDPDRPVFTQRPELVVSLEGFRQNGSINSNIVFTNTNRIVTGDGQDTFNLAISEGNLGVEGGGGDDVFRFAKDNSRVFGSNFTGDSITAYGNDGNDRFVYLPGNRSDVVVIGGDGADVADHRFSGAGVSADFFGGEGDGPFYEGSHWREIETFMAAAGQDNRIELRTQSTGTRFDWTVDGDITTIHNTGNGATVEVHNFNQFQSGSKSLDWFHVKETARDIEIIDGDQIRISSDFDLSKGDLSGIKHDVSIVRRGSYFMALPPNVFTFSRPLSVDVDGITVNPDVFISSMAGEGVVATFGSDQTIQLRGGGSIQFVDEQPTSNIDPVVSRESTPFQPHIVMHGSASQKDVFVVEETWTPTTIFSHDGDDTFFIGSTNEAADGDLSRIAGELTIGAGRGTDRLYFNNQAHSESARYELSGNSLAMIQGFAVRIGDPIPTTVDSSDGSTILTTVSGIAHGEFRSTINFNSAVEVVRVNGSSTHANNFSVLSDTAAKLIVTGSTNPDVEDRVSIRFAGTGEPLPAISYSLDDPKTGSAILKRDPFGSVFFREVEVANLATAFDDGTAVS